MSTYAVSSLQKVKILIEYINNTKDMKMITTRTAIIATAAGATEASV
jgi:hypothetical protein